MKMQTPSILNYLSEQERDRVTFFRPSNDNGLLRLNVLDSEESPAATVMAIRKLRLQPGTVIPFHCHRRKEKVYIHYGNSHVEVLIEIGGEVRKFMLRTKDDRLVIPPCCWHAVNVGGLVSGISSSLLIITSDSNPDDILWEDEMERLLLNKHLF